MLMRPASVLLLDEPTNHLDMAAKDVLLEALRSFDGTVVFVSHDRYFLEGLADRVIEVGGETIRDHPGGYESYLWRTQQEAERAAAAEALKSERSGSSVGGRGAGGMTATSGVTSGVTAGEGPATGRRSRVTIRRVRELEERIATLEERKGKLEALLAREDFYRDAEKSAFYLDEYRVVGSDLETAMDEWAAASEQLDEARGEL
jgi:ATP-binding cassette subfamily F protein 3